MRRSILNFFLVSTLLVTFTSCSKDGDAGAAGKDGAPGAPGKDGNANITAFTFTNKTFTGALDLEIPNITQGFVDSSMLLVYYNPSNESPTAWYTIPGMGSLNSFDTRMFLYQTATSPSKYSLGIRLLKPDGSGAYASPVTFTKIRVFFAKITTTVPLSGRSTSPRLDYTDYFSVCRYYNLAQ